MSITQKAIVLVLHW